MRRKFSMEVDAAIVALACRQHGLVTRKQLLRLGLGADAITYRADRGRLHRVHLGVYAVGRPPGTALERAAAAVLACGLGAALSHGSALTLWGLTKRWQLPFAVTVPSDRRRPGVELHRTKLTRPEIRIQLGVRVTSPARTLLDCAPDLPPPRLARLVNEARLNGLMEPDQLAEVLRRGCG